jgi:hypothetical protein
MLDKNGVIAYIGAHAKEYNVDPAALLAVALGEGLNTSPGSFWTVPGEPVPSFGPPSWYQGGAGGAIVKAQGNVQTASNWSWSPDGLDYWMKQASQSSGVAGASGLAAITAIVSNFERPASQYVSGNINNALQAYVGMQNAIAGFTDQQGNIIVPVPPNAGTTPGQTITPPVTGGGGPSQDVRLGQIGPLKVGIPSGLVLGLLGMSLLALGAILFVVGGRTRVTVHAVGGTARVAPRMRGQL